MLACYAVGQVVQGDGFLAAFFGGLAVTIFNVSLCDCFLEYGEVTAEMAMLLAFVLFGAVFSTLLATVALVPALILAVITLGVARPLALWLVLQRATMSNTARIFIGWFGPRGLSSLLLALLAVQAGLPEGEKLLAITGVVVLLSVVLHGASATPLAAWYGRRVERQTLAEEREATAAGLFQADASDVLRITVGGAWPRAWPRRTRRSCLMHARDRSMSETRGRSPAASVPCPIRSRNGLPRRTRGRLVVAYCSCPNELTSAAWRGS